MKTLALYSSSQWQDVLTIFPSFLNFMENQFNTKVLYKMVVENFLIMSLRIEYFISKGIILRLSCLGI